MKQLTEEELEKAVIRHARRRKVFEEEGLSVDDAFDLAEKLFDRDNDPFDDRRVCFECDNYSSPTKTCLKTLDKYGRPQTPLRFILQRCEMFTLRGKK
jgi:queuine/archaeosine tRNA-ribosyltransferase